MLPATDEEKAEVTTYFLGQSPLGTTVKFLQKVYSEAIIDHRHDVWDIHSSDGRWWVITNPTNLYSQDKFPNMDYAVTFHMGLCLRIPRSHRGSVPVATVREFASVYARLREMSDALGQAQNVADYQAIGMRSREALLAFVATAQDVAEWTNEAAPKRADFRAWSDLICNALHSGGHQKERRHLLKTLLGEAWTFANWLTHAKSATWRDAEAAHTTTEHGLGMVLEYTLKYLRDVPEACPTCGSPHLSPQEGWQEDMPEVAWERPVCDDCGWTGAPVVVGERLPVADEEALITREGSSTDGECVVAEVPLTWLKRPGE